MKIRFSVCISFIGLLMALSSCVSTKNVQRNGYILDRNKVKTDNNSLSVEELEGFINQKPNGKTLGLFRLSTFFYERFKPKWIKETIGKKPVILDTILVNTSMREMKLYMAAKGYFHSVIDKKIKLSKKGARVTYIVHSGKPYTLKSVSYSIKDEQLADFVLKDKKNSLITSGINYDAYLLDAERHRITNYLRNQGYYFFNRDFILYKVDSSLNTMQMDLTIEFQQPKLMGKEAVLNNEKNHVRYKINDIVINTDYRFSPDQYVAYDTITTLQDKRDTTLLYKNYFLYRDKLRLATSMIDQFIFLRGGHFYGVNNADLTHNRLSSLSIVRFVNMSFEPVADTLDQEYKLLNCIIDLGRNPTQIFTIETEGTNTGGFLGLGGNLVYSNRNLFRGGEVFSIKLKGGLEMQQSFGESSPFFLGFNTVETGIELRLNLPKLLSPLNRRRFARYAVPGTTFTTGFNFQRRPDYTRYIINFSFGYDWRETVTKNHVLIPAEINSVRISRTDEFSTWLEELKDPRLIYQYTNHLVPLARYIFTYNNQPLRKNRDFIFFRGNLESSGNLLYLSDKMLNQPLSEQGFYTKLGIRYAQFVRAETDFRYYKFINPKSNLVFRIAGGVGVPYGNSDVLPVEKGFYAGGANGIRGWEIRSLGPGTFSDPENAFDKMGEVWMESNVEYRFPFYKFLHGAVFTDAGNIWLLKDNPDFPGGKFETPVFYEHIAVSAGIGLRFDLSFFVFRIDSAIKVKNPSKPIGERWVDLSKFQFKNIVWNFGIGYPF